MKKWLRVWLVLYILMLLVALVLLRLDPPGSIKIDMQPIVYTHEDILI